MWGPAEIEWIVEKRIIARQKENEAEKSRAAWKGPSTGILLLYIGYTTIGGGITNQQYSKKKLVKLKIIPPIKFYFVTFVSKHHDS